MKIKMIETNEKSCVNELRKIRDNINLEIQDLSLEQLRAYWSKQKTLHPAKIWK